MGFHSSFTTKEYDITWPDWFVEKYSELVNFGKNNWGCISSKQPKKYYMAFEFILQDIQRALNEQGFFNKHRDNFVFVYLHNCGDITRVQIEAENILFSEVAEYKSVTEISHDSYCAFDCAQRRLKKETE